MSRKSQKKGAALTLSSEERKGVQLCLDLLQQAQHLVDKAGQALCPVRGFAEEWTGLGEPYEVIKRHWYKVDNRWRAFLYRLSDEQQEGGDT